MAEPKWVLLEDLPKEVRLAVRLKAKGAQSRDPIGVAWENNSRIARFGDIYHSWRTGKMEVCLADRHPDGSQYIYRPVYDWHEWGSKWPDADVLWVHCWKSADKAPVPSKANYCPLCGEEIYAPRPETGTKGKVKSHD